MSKGAQLARVVAAEIGRGRPSPGSPMLPLSIDARQRRVSTAVIREARQLLQAAGVIEVRHGSGAWISVPQHWRLTEPLGLIAHREQPDHQRIVLQFFAQEQGFEEDAVRLITGAAEPRDFRALTRALEAFDQLARSAASTDPGPGYDRLDREFHWAIVCTAGNRALSDLSAKTHPILVDAAMHQRRTAADAAADRAEHRAIYRAVVTGDAAGAVLAVRTHFSSTMTRRAANGPWIGPSAG